MLFLDKYSDFFTSYCKEAIIFLLVANEIVSEPFLEPKYQVLSFNIFS